jgi:microcystin-dependent protein
MGTIPVGTVIAFGGIVQTGPFDPPAGWLLCDGSAVSRADYATLFTAIGTSCGEGDGQTTFNLPDHRGSFLRGVDGGVGRDKYSSQRHAANVGGSTGDAVGSVQPCYTALPTTAAFVTDTQGAHTHPVPNLPIASSWYPIAGSHYAEWNTGSVSTSPGGAHSHTVTGGDAESRPVNAYVNYLIFSDYFPT